MDSRLLLHHPHHLQYPHQLAYTHPHHRLSALGARQPFQQRQLQLSQQQQQRQQQQQQAQHQQSQHLLSSLYHPGAYHEPSLLYHPVQLTYSTQHLIQQQQQQQQQLLLQRQQQQQRQLALTTSSQPVQSHLHRRQLPTDPQQSTLVNSRPNLIMTVPQVSDEELAELQKLSNEYEPDVNGPYVSERISTSHITTEYAMADPIYQAKTANLPQKYSYYRTVRGDGSCGWRAIAFGYFEALVRSGNQSKIYEELARLQSLLNIMTNAGYSMDLLEDFSEATFTLLRNLAEAFITSFEAAETLLIERFNDFDVQMCIITHLRTLTASWMKTHHEEYSNWLVGQSVDQYCDSQILPVSSEIDDVGLTALNEVLLAPVGIVLEIAYLDRSAGSEVNMHRIGQVDVGSPTGFGNIKLLYRPGHYDLLYQSEDLPSIPLPSHLGQAQAQVPTYFQFTSQPRGDDFGVPDIMTMIPGMSFASHDQNWMSAGYGEPPELFPTSPAIMNCAQAVTTPTVTNHQPPPPPPMQASSLYVPPPAQSHISEQLPQELAIRSLPTSLMSQGHSGYSLCPFRPSAWELDPSFVEATSTTQFQTAIFKNSHFNTAHFNNPDFQPEQWDPDDDYVTATSNSKHGRHRNSG